MQAEDPELELYVPIGQLAHCEYPVESSVKVPAGHKEHAADPLVLLNEPGAHAVHVSKLVAPTVSEKVPDGHRLHSEEPTASA